MEMTGTAKQQVASVWKTASDLDQGAVHEIAGELRSLLADTFALYIKTKNFHWHMKGRHFRDYHLLLDEHADQLFGITDEIAERARKLGATTLRSIGDITRHQRLQDSDLEHIAPEEMLGVLCTDNRQLTRFLRVTHEVCDRYHDVATASLIEVWIDQAERRAWLLTEIVSGMA
jgi:starvation-inducible DNA-binding protein